MRVVDEVRSFVSREEERVISGMEDEVALDEAGDAEAEEESQLL